MEDPTSVFVIAITQNQETLSAKTKSLPIDDVGLKLPHIRL
jgi:hypothetical protein